ncbi:MAG: ammonia-forming cytochrome c nitrite reductase subunit c552 [Candidatus Krumholzibacteria bacterium]|nr:ammonia-forming cytochrome c nitrite reductase subunit c552 [Candidatus Krumholzibacteria bacterium]
MIRLPGSATARTAVATFVATAAATIAVTLLLINIFHRRQEALEYPHLVVPIPEGELDPSVWGRNFPYEHDSFVKTEIDYGRTEYGGSEKYSKLERYPAMKILWAGYSFAVDHDEERGHHWSLEDQKETRRTTEFDQPGACVNCHAAEAPRLIAEMGWEAFNRTPYNDLRDSLHIGSSCADCHDPATMDLVITRPALKHALENAGVDLSKATRQEMRSFVCAQCHVEYYFLGEDKILTFPWSRGRTVDGIEEHYDEYGFSDWTHPRSGAPMIKIQHPEFEMWGTGVHARSGVSCADCHMPYVREGSFKVSDHRVRSPLDDISRSCQACHPLDAEELEERVLTAQNTTAALLRGAERAIEEAIGAIVEAREAGVSERDLEEALALHRSSQLRWDFVSSENSTGFHSPQEAARILAESIDLARRAQIGALRARR